MKSTRLMLGGKEEKNVRDRTTSTTRGGYKYGIDRPHTLLPNRSIITTESKLKARSAVDALQVRVLWLVLLPSLLSVLLLPLSRAVGMPTLSIHSSARLT